jgi:hypothetical protein
VSASDPHVCRSALPIGVVACCRLCLCVAHSAGVDDAAGVAVLSLSARIKNLFPDRRSTLVGWLPCCAICMNGCLLALRAAVISRATLLAYAGCRAFVLLHGHLLDERLRLVVQVLCLGR